MVRNRKLYILYLHICNKFVTMTRRVSISLDKEQLKLLHSVKGFGKKEAEKVKNILLAYLSEKGYLEKFNKKKVK